MIESIKDLFVNDIFRIVMNNGFNCVVNVIDFWFGKKYIFNFWNYLYWNCYDFLMYMFLVCEVNVICFDLDSIYYFD